MTGHLKSSALTRPCGMGVYISRWKLYGEKILLLPRRNKGLLKHCDAPAPYPSFEGEKGKAKKAKEEVIRVKGPTPHPSFEGKKGKAKKAKEEVIRKKRQRAQRRPQN